MEFLDADADPGEFSGTAVISLSSVPVDFVTVAVYLASYSNVRVLDSPPYNQTTARLLLVTNTTACLPPGCSIVVPPNTAVRSRHSSSCRLHCHCHCRCGL